MATCMLRVLILCLVAVGQAQAAYSALYVFGDSLSDTGNNAIVVPPALGLPAGAVTTAPYVDPALPGAPLVPVLPYAGQRYSNGAVWIDYLAGALGLTATPSVLGGTNHAFGGARSGALPVPPDAEPDVPTVLQQIDAATASGTLMLPGDALYVLWAGGNDVRDAGLLAGAGLLPEAGAAVEQGVMNMATALVQLGTAGARHILVPNVPDLGLTPIASWLDANVNPLASTALTALSAGYNAGLAAELPGLAAALGADIMTLDIFSFVQQAAALPPPGFNVTDACTSGNGFAGCGDPQAHLFWDAIHPTAIAHAAIADLAYATVVPLPAAWLLLASCLGLLARGRRLRIRPT